ncbi:GMC oxidoreductase [Rhizoctonia solani]|uniref:GMC oxidoreductase n=1 Tax=Rhizoctonia solani TaxID=456999 RepID=A0A8H7M4L5_9AGAM|nr:GMC oxidoreductase [Rhizoctonia solani]
MNNLDLDYDVFIAGSGPLGYFILSLLYARQFSDLPALRATYARQILETHESARVLMVEVGAQESPVVGMNLKNEVKYQKDFDAFSEYLDSRKSSFMHIHFEQFTAHIIRGAMQPMSIPPAGGFLSALQGDAWSQPEGRSSVASPYNPDQDHTQALGYGASLVRLVVCLPIGLVAAVAEPHDDELIQSPIERSEMRKLLERGKKLLNVHTDQFDTSIRHQLVKKALTDAYQSRGINATNLPLAAERSKVNDTLIDWSGMNTLLTEYLVVKFEADPDAWENQECIGAKLRTRKEEEIKAKVFIATCGVICTPQLLWNSGIRHKALGCFLTGHSHSFCQMYQYSRLFRKTLLDTLKTNSSTNSDPNDEIPIPLDDLEPQVGIPYSPSHPFHTQFHRDAFSYGDVGPQIDQRVVLDIRYFCMLEVQESNRISFATEDRLGRPNTDIYGMPQPTFHFKTTAKDNQLAQIMMKEMCEAANILGSYLPSAPRSLSEAQGLETIQIRQWQTKIREYEPKKAIQFIPIYGLEALIAFLTQQSAIQPSQL